MQNIGRNQQRMNNRKGFDLDLKNFAEINRFLNLNNCNFKIKILAHAKIAIIINMLYCSLIKEILFMAGLGQNEKCIDRKPQKRDRII